MNGSHAVFIVYSIDRPRTFDDVDSTFLKEVKEVCGADTVIVLVGTKFGLEDSRRVTIDDLRDKA